MRALPLLSLCVLLAACKGIGRPIVDHVPPPPPVPPIEPSCEPVSCDDPPRVITLSDDTAVAITSAGLGTCATSQTQQIAPPALRQLNGVYCQTLQLDLTKEPSGECSFEVDALRIEHSTLLLRASSPCSARLSGMQALDVRIDLQGPVALRVDGSARLLQVGVIGIATQAGEPSLMLEGMEGHRMVIGDVEHPFEGALIARNAYLNESSVVAGDSQLETTLFERTHLDVTSIVTADAYFERAQLDVGTAVFAASRLEHSELRSCDNLSLIDSHVVESVLRGCGSRPYRVIAGSVEQSVVDGIVESDGARFSSVRFGVDDETDLVMFEGGVSRSAFCEHAVRYRFGANAGVSCSSCIASSLFEQQGVCMLPGADRGDGVAQECAAFDQLRDCRGPVPGRPRDRSSSSSPLGTP